MQYSLRQDLPTILLFSFFSLCSFWVIASQLTPAHDFLSIPLASGRGCLLLSCALRALHILLCCLWSPGPSLFSCQGYCPLPFEPGTALSHLLPVLLLLGSHEQGQETSQGQALWGSRLLIAVGKAGQGWSYNCSGVCMRSNRVF